MNIKLGLFCLLIITWAGLSSCALHSNYKLAQEEAKRRNSLISGAGSDVAIDMTSPSPGWTEEVLVALVTNQDELAIRVRSGGCIQKDDFWIQHHFDEESKAGQPHYLLTIYRVQKDECKAFYPSGVLIKFNLREKLGMPISSTYSVTNKVEKGVFVNK